MEARIFKWSCLAIATAASAAMLWMLNDMRREVKRTNEVVGERLPQILENVQKGTDTLARVSKDIDSLRDLAGISDVAKDRSLVVYADSILDFLEKQSGQIGLAKVVGNGMKDLIPVQDWARDARKEALWLTVRASTKGELLERLGKNKFGSDWYFAPTSGEPLTLINFLKSSHPDSRSI
jgi:hypothetical protein